MKTTWVKIDNGRVMCRNSAIPACLLAFVMLFSGSTASLAQESTALSLRKNDAARSYRIRDLGATEPSLVSIERHLRNAMRQKRYVGFVNLPAGVLLRDGRTFQLTKDLEYIDVNGETWVVPAGYKTNGVSVPQVLWSEDFAPYSDKSRTPAILHDYICEHKITRSSRSAHLLFFEALRASVVSKVRAFLMHEAVFMFGDKWGDDGKSEGWPHWNYGPSREQCVKEGKANYPEGLTRLFADFEDGKMTAAQASKQIKKMPASFMERRICDRPQEEICCATGTHHWWTTLRKCYRARGQKTAIRYCSDE